jgi:hypothetical protein
MAYAKIKGKWKRVKTIKRDPYSSYVTIQTGKTKRTQHTISREKYKMKKSLIRDKWGFSR